MASGDARIPDAVQWHEGMFLAPQHFQQADQRQEALAALHAAHASPYHWGVRELAFDSVQLASGALRVTRLSAILPDGLVVEYDPVQDGDLVLDLKVLQEQEESFPVLVHLTVPRARDPDRPVSGSLPRYRSVETRHVVDENTGEDALAIPRLRPRLSLFAGQDVPEKYVGLPLARVTQHADSFALADFVPPHLRLSVAPG
ncbi:MAG: type VI secretion system baseplate subunit TssK, partial [Gemmatimonadetes bacterium]